MKKLKLNLDDLKVESFATTQKNGSSGNGTVYGYGGTFSDACTFTGEFGCMTCFDTDCCTEGGLTCESPDCRVKTE